MTHANFYVYVHSRLSTGEPFYVGKGFGRRHKRLTSRSQHWKNIVAKDGGCHTSFVKRDLDEEFAFLLERELIDKYRRQGVVLINRTDGGDGASGVVSSRKGKPGKKHSDETKLKMSLAHMGVKKSESHRINSRMARLAIGHRHTAEYRARMSELKKGIPSGRKGVKFSEEVRKRMSESRLAWYRAQRGKVPS